MHIRDVTLIHQPPVRVFDFVADERNNYDATVIEAELLTNPRSGPEPDFAVSPAARVTGSR